MENLNIKALESWIHLNKVSGEKDDTVEITCDENQTESQRTGKVVITTSKGKICNHYPYPKARSSNL